MHLNSFCGIAMHVLVYTFELMLSLLYISAKRFIAFDPHSIADTILFVSADCKAINTVLHPVYSL